MVGIIWALSALFVLTGTALVCRRLNLGRKPAIPQTGLPAISVLKPLKGADSGMRDNLESFFQVDYPEFELLFSVAEGTDPAVAVVNELRKRYPQVSARLLCGAENVGMNPKVNNLTRSYRQASYDIVLISDSNVRIAPDYLRKKVAFLTPDVGVVTAAVAGIQPKGLGGMLEAVYLNTFYARGMSLAFATGNPCVVGKSMLFRRSVAARFGGIRALADYLAEDFAFGEEMRKLGLKVAMMDEPVNQFIGVYSFRSFWDRHLRWGRIRKVHAPAAFLLEPLTTPMVSGILLSLSLHSWHPMLYTFALCGACDILLMTRISRRFDAWAPFAWLLRESLSLPLWFAVAGGNTVEWRGSTLTLSYGGKIQERDEEWAETSSSGAQLPARTRSKGTTIAATGGLGKPQVILREG
ncbi:MAG: ceramide glucosyltransferase [Bdellovibrionota bacterium]